MRRRLILFSFAVGAVATGGVSIIGAAETFAIIVIGEIVWGLAIAWTLLHLRAWSKDTEVEMILALLTPFCGVLAAAFSRRIRSAGSGNGGPLHESARTRIDIARNRLQGFFVWGLAVLYLVEGRWSSS